MNDLNAKLENIRNMISQLTEDEIIAALSKPQLVEIARLFHVSISHCTTKRAIAVELKWEL